MATSAPAPAPAALTPPQRDDLLQWLQTRGQQQKATTFELLVRRVQATFPDPMAHLDAVRLARAFIADAGIVEVRPLEHDLDGSDGAATD